jgi:hypothetical protein
MGKLTPLIRGFILTSVLPAGLAVACPMCKESVPNSDAPQASGLPGGFNFSVYYMLIGLFLTMGLIAGVVVKGIRSTNARMAKVPRASSP